MEGKNLLFRSDVARVFDLLEEPLELLGLGRDREASRLCHNGVWDMSS